MQCIYCEKPAAAIVDGIMDDCETTIHAENPCCTDHVAEIQAWLAAGRPTDSCLGFSEVWNIRPL